ncbi:MAG: Fe-S cluster protein [Deltaproteobacteria bacterium]|nr:MAG: Fe-S cluster protein [Deltaproteobacteria bacterium]
MAGLGLVFGVVLAVASRLLKVEEDPRLDMVEEALPGSNCGACGLPGCRAFAEALLAGTTSPSGCSVSSPEAIDAIADMLGVDAGVAVARVARLHCAGGRAQAVQVADYQGVETCAGAALVGAAGKSCTWGCIGLGDCEVACSFGAITMNDNGLPVVAPALCTACGDCVTACPRDLFELLPADQHIIVQCSVPLAGEEALALCTVACDACGRCAQDAPPGLITMVGNLPVVDYSGGGPATPMVVQRCPTGAIRWVEGEQLQEQRPVEVAGRSHATVG